MHALALLGLIALTASAAPAPEADGTGLRAMDVPVETLGKPIVRSDFGRCTPAHVIKKRAEDKSTKWLAEGPAEDRAKGHWLLRHPGWTQSLINVVGTPPDLVYDPKLEGVYDVYLGLRAVTPSMSLAVKLSDEPEFLPVSAPAATTERHFDFEFHWKVAAELAGRQIVVRATGHPIYLQHIRFVPHISGQRTLRVATDHVTICKAAGRHFAFPGIARLPNRDLAVVSREGEAHVCALGRIVLSRSTDNGRTWQPRVCIWDSPSDDRDPAILVLPSGRIAVTFNTWNSWMTTEGLREKYREHTARIEKDGLRKYTGRQIMFSDDNGRTWSQPIRIPVFSPHGPTVGPDGHLYYPGAQAAHGKRYIVLWRSTDQGVTWERHGEVGYTMEYRNGLGREVYWEPQLCTPPEGPWITTIRAEPHGHIVQARSVDAGRHWTVPRQLKIRGFPQHILPLSDGRLLMAYGYRYQPFGVRGRVSRNGGKSWDAGGELVFRYGAANGDLGYPVSIEFDGGQVLTVYYYVEPNGDCFIEGAFHRP